ncbi:RimJ/RimL family protein N-acetyltransferase [Knoellia remsis]|jgi:RimJ/RimL family protein N-acetyltransferase|uniref:RimJ/RimL family protein N-acetyltransferase n=1 Tax=Knoellia remsis TaxID=407159 RepID=A0A2T0UMY1_9MICO|nr:GNAT family protein [Knoellia remsis]PRY59270.1 RimJ/RimL family protein N-acetyltransferase [Knoellia remsis]
MSQEPETNEFGQRVGPVVEGWTPRPPLEPTTLEGRYVRVAPLSEAHFSDLFAATCGPDDGPLWTYRPVAKPANLAGLWMHLAAALEDDAQLPFSLIPTEGERAGTASGIAAYMRVEPRTGQAEVAGVLHGTGLRRTRAATEAIHLLMRHAFDLGYRRFEWKCDSLNEPSQQAARRLGFTYEGRFRNHMVTQGRSRDTDWFSVTSEEWPAVRAAHEAWLDPANFDESGQQRASLRV